jgi:hypothetical protein
LFTKQDGTQGWRSDLFERILRMVKNISNPLETFFTILYFCKNVEKPLTVFYSQDVLV